MYQIFKQYIRNMFLLPHFNLHRPTDLFIPLTIF